MSISKNDAIQLLNPCYHVVRNHRLSLLNRLSVIGGIMILAWLPLTILMAKWITKSDEPIGGFPDTALIGILISTAWLSAITYWAGKGRGLSEAERLVNAEINNQIAKHSIH